MLDGFPSASSGTQSVGHFHHRFRPDRWTVALMLSGNQAHAIFERCCAETGWDLLNLIVQTRPHALIFLCQVAYPGLMTHVIVPQRDNPGGVLPHTCLAALSFLTSFVLSSRVEILQL